MRNLSGYRFLFCENQNVISGFLKQTHIEPFEDDTLDGAFYKDKISGQIWELYTYDDFEMYREPYPKGIRVYPYPNPEQIIDVICEHKGIDEVKGACRLLLEQERVGIEFRELLINRIEALEVYKNHKIYKVIYNQAELYDSTNQRHVVGKRIVDIKSDHQYYTQLADRAKRLFKSRLFGLK